MAITYNNTNGMTERPDTTKPAPISASKLPPAASANITLEAASPAEWLQCQRLNAEEWKGPLSIEQYLQREKCLFNQNLTKNGKATGWMLTTGSKNADGTRQILASCETLLAEAYIAKDGKLDNVLTHGIGSVFTRKEHRGKGYAARMMTELCKKLETWQQHNGDRGKFSVLYSDIGENFYSRFGWKVFPSTHIHLIPLTDDVYAAAAKMLPETKDLKAEDIKSLPAVTYVEQDLQEQSRARPKTSLVAIKPDMDHFEWHHAREEFVCSALNKPFPAIKGAIHKATGVAVVWNRIFASDPQEWQLHILHTIIPSEMKHSIEGLKALSALLLRAQVEAHRWGLQGGVEVWDPSDTIISAAQNLRTEAHDKVEVISRDKEHVCSLRWSAPGEADADVTWLYNQKYAWC